MDKKEYIERAAIEKMLENAQIISNGEYSGYCMEDINLYSIPIADVVEVVRCKDCIWRGREECAMIYRCDCGEQHTWETDNDFCSYGERRD